MKAVYDFSLIREVKRERKRLLFRYAIYLLGFILASSLACAVSENSLLTSVILGLLLFFFILFSVVFWKIKYRITRDYERFLDDMETGMREECIGVYGGKSAPQSESELFERYVFVISGKRTELLIRKEHSVRFSEGEKYHLECVGSCILQWEIAK